jgi:nucleoside-diphosphate-sugar epimerase
MSGSPELHVVFGAGQIGVPLARLLLARGHAVRLVSRSGSGGAEVPAAEIVRADAVDAAATAAVARGATALYHCMNPAYDTRVWESVLPRIHESLVGASGRAGARLVALGNLYPLGRPDGHGLDEDSPARPCSRKGEARARADALLLEAHRRGDARVAIGRASDFYGPRGEATHFNARFWSRVLHGKSGQVLFDPGTPHTYHYVEDVAAGLAALGAAGDDVFGRTWMLPCSAAEPTHALAARFEAALGRPVRLERVPRALLRVMAVFSPIMRELLEMTYQWDAPFVVDDRRFRARFGLAPTTADEGARRTVEWARARFGPAARRAA